ncbi:carbonic anhydrase [uncultured Microscilla sp.]|uniref:carbonic anhydrase n=1 Tax=uncultured Microscilla sp. TaxID=432653 RepID=UPI00261A76F5|nr:carbonic anhydrase family protein [uncultured Microscilla sp.]
MKKSPIVLLAICLWLLLNGCGINSSEDSRQRVTSVDTTPNDSMDIPYNAPPKVPKIDDMKLHNSEVAYCLTHHRQSPINLNTPGKKAAHTLTFNYVSSHEVVKNLGHTVELEYDKGSSVVFDDKTYQLIQFHFHTPSEHRIDAERYPMEAHLVHQAADSTFLVISLLFEEKKENTFLKRFINDIPKTAGDSTEKSREIDLTKFFPSDQRFYTYSGSLTTPPYTEGVRWVIFKQPVNCSKTQLDIFKKTEGFNARKLQPMNLRKLEEF